MVNFTKKQKNALVRIIVTFVLFAGLFLGTRYSFRGPDINTTVNAFVTKAQDKAAMAVEARVE